MGQKQTNTKVVNMTGDVQSVEKCILMFFSKWHKGKSPFVFFLRSGSDSVWFCVFVRVVCVCVIVCHFVDVLVTECFVCLVFAFGFFF